MAAVLAQVARRVRRARARVAPAESATEAGRAGARLAPVDRRGSALDHVFATFDEEHGGFGIAPKFPLVAPLHLALDLFAETARRSVRDRSWCARSTRWDGAASTTTRTAGSSAMRRRATGSSPHVEKLLEVNAALLRLYLDAGAALGTARFTERGADALRYIQNWLADPVDGGVVRARRRPTSRYYAAGVGRGPPGVARPGGRPRALRGLERRDGLRGPAGRARLRRRRAPASSR